MARGRSSGGRSGGEWTIRGLLALLAAGLGYASVTATLGNTLAIADPARAAKLAPGNGRVAGLLAQRLISADATPAERARADRIARKALGRDPTSVAAVVALGLDAQLGGDGLTARRLFRYSQRLSRRNLPTQLWAVEDAVGRGDIVGALRHYDIALRTSNSARDVMFPVLASAIGDPGIRSALVRTLTRAPAWKSDFVDYVASEGPDPRNNSSFFLALQRAGVAVPAPARAAVTNALLARQMISDAWSYYAATHPGADRHRSRDPDFRAGSDDPTGFDWNIGADSGISVTIQRDDGILDFSVPASIGGTLVQQLQMLPAGNYLLIGHSVAIDQAEDARPYWVLSCADGRELGRTTLPNSDTARGLFAGRFRVPEDCPVQTLALVARPSEAVGGISGQIKQVVLKPA